MLRAVPPLLGLYAVALAGCGSAENAANTVAAATENAAERIDQAADAVEAAGNAVAPPAASDVLGGYVGKHPRETVGGTTFLDQPVVRDAVAKTVGDAKVRDFVFGYNGPDAPIVLKDGRVLAWGCEVHNCGFHNWSISISPDGAVADICHYHNDDSVEGSATWYLAGGKTEQRAGNCPSE